MKSRLSILIHRFHRDAIFFFFYVQPRRYASGHVLFYDCVRNERDAREKIENERVDGLRSDIENAKLAGGYKSLAGRLFDSFRSVLFRGHPERVRCLISLSDFERRCRALLHHLSPCNDRLRVRIPWWSTCVGGCAAPCYAHAYTRARARMSVPFNDSLRFLSFSRMVCLCSSSLLSHYHTNCSQSTNQRFIGMSLVYCR